MLYKLPLLHSRYVSELFLHRVYHVASRRLAVATSGYFRGYDDRSRNVRSNEWKQIFLTALNGFWDTPAIVPRDNCAGTDLFVKWIQISHRDVNLLDTFHLYFILVADVNLELWLDYSHFELVWSCVFMF